MRKKSKVPEMTLASDDEEGAGDQLNSLKPDLFNPEDFLSANEKIATLSVDLLERIYNLAKSSENDGSLEDPLGLQTESLKLKLTKKKKKHRKISKAEAPVLKLITENFDEDQIWEEVEIQNKFMFENLVSSVSKLLAYQTKPLDQDRDSDVESLSDDNEVNERVHVEDEHDEDQDDSDFFESDEKYRKRNAENNKKYRKSVVDDKFFSLAQMTEYIERIEAEEEKGDKSKESQENEEDELSDDDDEESVDMFDMPNEEEEDKSEQEYFYRDFFDPPLESENDQGKSELENYDSLKKQASKFDSYQDEEESDKNDIGNSEDSSGEDDRNEKEESEDEEESPNDQELQNKINTTLSGFEKRKLQIQGHIEEIENEALQPKSWHLLGEATAESRPENALLEEHLIYDHLIRPAPAVTVEATQRLEDVIKNRIKDNAWDDVERKVRPVEDPREYKKRLVLDAEKSKASLAEIYEKEYLEQKSLEDGEKEEKEPEEHVKIRNDLKSLFQKLDSLSHFHFTPKQPPPEVKIISNAPSISIEETGGVSVSDANMLAPQEIQDHTKGVIKGHEERTDTDRKRERRKKKKKQHLKRLLQEEKARAKGLGLRNIKLAEGIVKSQAGKQVDGYSTSNQTAKELKSSKAFFTKLQQTVTSHIDKVANRKRTSSTNDVNKSAKKYKL